MKCFGICSGGSTVSSDGLYPYDLKHVLVLVLYQYVSFLYVEFYRLRAIGIEERSFD